MSAKGHVRHLVKINDAAMGLFQKTRFNPAFRGFATKQHLFHPLRLDSCAIDGHKGGIGPIGMGVDIARGDFLARPCRAGQHHAAIGFRHLVQLALHGAE